MRLANPRFLLPAIAGALPLTAQHQIPLGSLDLGKVQQDWGSPRRDRSVDGHALTIGGRALEHGLGTHANSEFALDLGGKGLRFRALVGADDETLPQHGTIEFRVVGDDKLLWQSGVMKSGEPAKEVDVALEGIKVLHLVVEDGGDDINYDHADWGEAVLTLADGAEATPVAPPREEPVILTPAPDAAPRLCGPQVFGVRPGHPVLFTLAATGRPPLTFAAEGLPAGVELDAATGRLTGVIAAPGAHDVRVTAANAAGKDTRTLRLVCGPTIALTPPLGWNSWNCFAGEVDDRKVRAAADAMVASGLAAHGWSYINIDDCWQGTRDGQGRIRPNAKFPDMKALGDYIHGKGLRFGVYTSPGPQTCAGFAGSWQHEAQDVATWSEWGVDYVKHDWCSYGGIAKDQSLPELQKPYRVMQAALAAAPRDIVYSLCQYGMGEVWKWGADVGGNCWRTTGDITDTWNSMAGIGFGQAGHEEFAGPGHWNDPDMLVVGLVGWGRLHPTKLSPNEQYAHISLWCLLAAPLLIGCDMAQLDPFTLSLLTNDEVLAVDQDPLGRQARRVGKDGDAEVWAKPMADGSLAVGLFWRGRGEGRVAATWAQLGITGPHRVRDLWRQRDVGNADGSYATTVPKHGVQFVQLFPAR
ncbi:MAG: NPCBM/NEW2 domain-containing protein [Planctomycetota bacterium]